VQKPDVFNLNKNQAGAGGSVARVTEYNPSERPEKPAVESLLNLPILGDLCIGWADEDAEKP